MLRGPGRPAPPLPGRRLLASLAGRRASTPPRALRWRPFFGRRPATVLRVRRVVIRVHLLRLGLSLLLGRRFALAGARGTSGPVLGRAAPLLLRGGALGRGSAPRLAGARARPALLALQPAPAPALLLLELVARGLGAPDVLYLLPPPLAVLLVLLLVAAEMRTRDWWLVLGRDTLHVTTLLVLQKVPSEGS